MGVWMVTEAQDEFCIPTALEQEIKKGEGVRSGSVYFELLPEVSLEKLAFSGSGSE